MIRGRGEESLDVRRSVGALEAMGRHWDWLAVILGRGVWPRPNSPPNVGSDGVADDDPVGSHDQPPWRCPGIERGRP